jgi:mRNA interferase RelE/StbE
MEEARYIVEFIDQEAIDQFESLPKDVQIVIGKAIRQRLETNPTLYGKPLRKNLIGYRRIRIGKYRVVYKIIGLKVVISVVDHREYVY